MIALDLDIMIIIAATNADCATEGTVLENSTQSKNRENAIMELCILWC